MTYLKIFLFYTSDSFGLRNMLFNSLEFAIFFVTFFFLYWFVFNRRLKSRNLLILLGSYTFYAWWDWRFLSLLAGSSMVNYFLGIYIDKSENEKRRRFLIFLGLLQGLGGLLFFKYFNFFIHSLVDAFSIVNVNVNIHTLNLILPLGISFYTFRAISYLLDIESGKIKPTTDLVVFFTYISFFPSLLSGPIDRAKTLIPQLEKKRIFDYNQAADGLRQILWGLFKKVVIADNCAAITSQIFDNYQYFPASSLLLSIFLYTIQFYADFSGYADMAIGFSHLLGFNITKNFNYPFFAQNIAEFWQRWHISLTAWMTEYVFTPLAFIFRGLGKTGVILAILINFVLVGLWHGANWTFIVFGLVQGCYFIPLVLRGALSKKKNISKDKLLPTFWELVNIVGTFTFIMLTTIIFRSKTIWQAYQYYRSFFSVSLFSIPVMPIDTLKTSLVLIIFVLIMLVVEWLQRGKEHGLQMDHFKLPVFKPIIYGTLAFVIFLFGATTADQFIYFEF